MLTNKNIFFEQQKLAVDYLKNHKREFAKYMKDREQSMLNETNTSSFTFPHPCSIFEKAEKCGLGNLREFLKVERKFCLLRRTN